MKKLPPIFRKKRYKKKRKSTERNRKGMFHLEALEPRIMLSADPIAGLTADLFMGTDDGAPEHPPALMDADATERRIDAALQESDRIYDAGGPAISDVKDAKDCLDAALIIEAGEQLAGSGALDVDLVNKGTLAPGHSPGVTDVAGYAQDADGVLEIEIAGTGDPGAADGYDQLNVAGTASFDGLLDVKIINGYDPKPGDTFDIITFGDVSGQFAEVDGLFGFKEDYYFEVVQTADRLQLVVRELYPNDGFSLDLANAVSEKLLGGLVNVDYFAAGDSSIQLQADFSLNEFISASGTFIVEAGTKTVHIASTDPAVPLSDTEVETKTFTIAANDLTLFAGLNAGEADAAGLNLDAADFALSIFTDVDDSSRAWIAFTGSAAGGALIGVPGFAFSATNAAVNLNLEADDGTVIDFAAMETNGDPWIVEHDPINSGRLDFSFMDGASGETIDLAADLDIDVQDFFHIDGSFAIEKSTRTIVLNDADASQVEVDLLTIGAKELDAFVGANAGTDDEAGLNMTQMTFALALFSEKSGDRDWKAVQADVGEASFVGVENAVLTVENAQLQINAAATDGTVVDFATMNQYTGLGLTAKTGPDATDLLKFSMDGGQGVLEQIALDLELAVDDYLTIEGRLALKKSTETATLNDAAATQVVVDALTIGGEDLSIFAGFNRETADPVGMEITGASFALALFTEQAGAKRKWMAFEGNGSAALLGFPEVEIAAGEMEVLFNKASNDGTVVDFSAMQASGNGLSVATGLDAGDQIDFTMNGDTGEQLKLAGNLDLNVSDFVTVSGHVELQKRAETVSLSDGTSIEVDALILGGDDVSAFAGLNGGGDDALGLDLSGTDFALALMTGKTDPTRQFMSLQASAGSASFAGLDGIEMSGANLFIDVNRADANGVVVDYASRPLDVVIGTGGEESVSLTLDGAEGEVLRVGGDVTLSAFDFFTVSGGIAIDKSSGHKTLDTGEVVDVNMLTVGADDIDAFIGVNSGKADALGLNVGGVSFALALMSDRADPARSWQSIQAGAADAAFVGLEDVTMAASDLSVEINQAAADGTIIDYSTAGLTVATGASTSLTFDMDGSRGELLRAAGNLQIEVSDFVGLSGGFAIEKTATTVTLSDGDDVAVDLLTIGATHVSAFAGLNPGTADAVGLDLDDVDFGLALVSEQEGTRQWTGLKVMAGDADVAGTDDLTLSASAVEAVINQSSRSGSVVDWAASPLAVNTGPTSIVTLDMDGSLGDLVQASGTLDLTVSDLFTVHGDFAFIKQQNAVTLSDGDEIDADMMIIGGNDVNAFAGVNGGTADAMGLAFEQIDFALVLMADRNDPGRRFTSLYASGDSAAFTGLDGLTLSADAIEVAVNQGLEMPAVAAGVETANTTYVLNIQPGAAETLTFSHDGGAGEAEILEADTDAEVIDKIAAGIEGLASIGAGNVQVTGSRLGGFDIEFIGDLAGREVADLTVSIPDKTAIAQPSAAVSEIVSAEAGVSEIQELSVETIAADPPPVTVSVSEVSAARLSANETASLTFTQPYTAAGDYEISIDGVAETVTFHQFMKSFNEKDIARALATILGGSASDVTVRFDPAAIASADGTHTYQIAFGGSLGNQDIGDIQVVNLMSEGDVIVGDGTDGATAEGEVQEVSISTTANGTYTLNMTHDGQTFTTSDLAFDAGPTQIKDALNAALSGLVGAAVTVAESADGYQVAFGGSLAGVDVANLQVDAAPEAPTPLGTFTVSLDGENSDPIAYNADTNVMAANIQTALENIAAIGTGNVSVVYDATASESVGPEFANYAVAFQGALADWDAPNLAIDNTNLTLTQVHSRTAIQGSAPVAEVQKVQIQTNAFNSALVLSLVHEGVEYASGPIAFASDPAEVQAVVDAMLADLTGANALSSAVSVDFWDGDELHLAFGVPLAGRDMPNLTVTTAAETLADVLVAEIAAATDGVSEVQELSVEAQQGDPPPVIVNVTEVEAARSAVNETSSLTFTQPYTAVGTYNLTIGGVSETVTFHQFMKSYNETEIASALATILGGSASDVIVRFDPTAIASADGTHTYAIAFKGSLGAQNIGDISVVSNLSAGNILVGTGEDGAAATGEVQEISVSTMATGTYVLSLDHDGRTFTTRNLSFDANPAQVEDALNVALSDLAGANATVFGTAGDYRVAFGGSLAGIDAADLRVSAAPEPETPYGTFTVSLDGETSGPIAYSANTTVMAANIQAALENMTAIGAGNASVAYNAASSDSAGPAFANYAVTFQGALANQNAPDMVVDDANLTLGQVHAGNRVQGAAPGAEVQTVRIATESLEGEFTLSLVHDGVDYASGSIDMSAGRSQVQAMVDAMFLDFAGADVSVDSWSGNELQLAFGGTLAGLDAPDLTVSTTARVSAATVAEITDGMAGASEILEMGVETFENEASPAVNETSSLTFTQPYTAVGNYEISIDGVAETVSFHSFTKSFNETDIAQALATLLGGTASDVIVNFDPDSAPGTHTYGITYTGVLGGRDIGDMTVVNHLSAGEIIVGDGIDGAPAIDPSGTFTISLGSETSDPIPYSADTAVMAASIQAALEAMTAIGPGNVSAVFDAAGSVVGFANYTVIFQGDLVNQDVKDLTVDATNMTLAAIHLNTVVQGIAPAREVQEIRISKDADAIVDGDVTLSLVHDGVAYASDVIDFSADRSEVRAIVDAMFADLAGAEASVDFWNGRQLNLSFGGSLDGVDLNPMTAFVSAAETVSLTMRQSGYATDIEAEPAKTVVVDYAVQALDALIGEDGEFLTFEINGNQGEMARISGHALLDIGGFVNMDAAFSLEKSAQTVTLDNGEADVAVNALTFGAQNTTLFAGLNGNTPDRTGFELADAEFGLALFADAADPSRKWTAFQAAATSVGTVNMDAVNLSASSLDIELNQAANDGSVVDFAAVSDSGTPFAVSTGSNGAQLAFDMDGEQLRAVGRISLDVLDFFSVEGDFAVEKSTQTLALASGGTVNADILAIGATTDAAFVGLNNGETRAIGFDISDPSFALVLASDDSLPSATRTWTALQVEVGGAVFSGIDDLTVDVNSLTVEINQAADDGSIIDFKTLPLTVATGPGSSLDMTMDGRQGPLVRVRGDMDIAISDFVALSGEVAFVKSTTTVTLSDGASVEADMMTLGTANVNAFLGVNAGAADAVGLHTEQVDMALALLSEKNGTRKWTALEAEAATAAFVGVTDLTAEAADIHIEGNQPAADGTVVDFAQTPLDVAVGPGLDIALEMDGSNGPLLRASADLDINAFNFVRLDGQFAIEKKSETVTLSDGDTENVDMLTLGGSVFTAYTGLNAADPNALGLKLGGVNAALVLMSGERRYAALQATAKSAALVGLSGVELSADNLTIYVNRSGDGSGVVVDYAAQPLDVAVGNSEETVSMTMEGAKGPLALVRGRAAINLFDAAAFEGDFALESSSQQVVVSDNQPENSDGGETREMVQTEMLTLGMADATGFMGMNESGLQAAGLTMEDANLALAMFDETNGDRRWTTLQADVGAARFAGVDDVGASIRDVRVLMNRAADDGMVIDYAFDGDEAVLTDPDDATVELRATDLSVEVGADDYGVQQTVTFDLNDVQGDFFRVGGYADLDLFDSVKVSGGFTIEKSTNTIVKSNLGTAQSLEDARAEQFMETLTIGVYQGSAFFGRRGPDEAVTTDDVGVALEGVDLALAMMTDLDYDYAYKTVQANVENLALVGVNGVDVEVEDARLIINQADHEGWVVDYRADDDETNATDLTVVLGLDETGAEQTLAFDIDDDRGDFLEISGHARVDFFETLKVEGGFAIGMTNKRPILMARDGVQLADVATADVLTIGMNNIAGFAGHDRDPASEADDLGLGFDNANLALAIFNESNGDRRWMTLSGNAGGASMVGLDGFNVLAADAVFGFNRAASDGSVVDFAVSDGETAATELAVQLGVDADGETKTVAFDMDGNAGEASRISGNLTLNMDNFVTATGDYALVRRDHQNVLVDGEQVDASLVTLAISDATAFAGSDGVGLDITDADLALALFSENSENGRSWTALEGRGNAAFVGIDALDVSLESASILYNKAAGDGSLIDFGQMASDNQDFGVTMGTDDAGQDETVWFSMDADRGAMFQIAGDLTLTVAAGAAGDFIHVSGGFAFEKGQFSAQLGNEDKTVVDTDLLTFGLSDADMFAGYDHNGADETGIRLDGVDLALAILNERQAAEGETPRQWISIKAQADSAGFVTPLAMPDLQLRNAGLEINLAAADGSAVDYKETGLDVAVGPNRIVALDFDDKSLKIVGGLKLNLEDYLVIDGRFGFEMSAKNLTLDNGDTVDARVLVFSMDNADLFAGFHHGADNEMGLSLENATLGVALVSGAYGGAVRQWTSVQGRADAVRARGIPGLSLEGENIGVTYNSIAGGAAIDYNQSNSAIAFGDAQFDMTGHVLRVTGAAELAVGDFFRVGGVVDVTRSVDTVTLSNGSHADVDVMGIAGFDLNAFAGLNGNSDNPTGFVLEDAGFAFAAMSEQGGDQRTWTALKADVGRVGFTGMDRFDITGEDILVDINTGAINGDGQETVVDFAAMLANGDAMTFADPLGKAQTIVMNMAGGEGAYIELSGVLNLNLFDFYKTRDDFNLRIDLKTLQLADGGSTSATIMKFAKSDINAAAGLGGIGFEIDGVDFGLAIVADGTRAWASLKATADTAAFTGIDRVTAQGTDLAVLINTGAFTLGPGGVVYEPGQAIDYSAVSLDLSDGITLGSEMNRDMMRVSGSFDLNLFDFLSVSGDLAFDKSTRDIVLQESNNTVSADVMSVSATDVTAFAGFVKDDYRLGFEIQDVDFALAFFSDRTDRNNQWTSLTATAAQGGLVGVDGLGIGGSDLAFGLNTHTGAAAIDFDQTGFSVNGVDFTYNKANASRIEGQMDVNIFGLYSTSDYYSFDKNFQTVVFDDGQTGKVDIITLGGHIDNVFLGVNKGTPNAVGFEMTDAGFGLALTIDVANPTNYWITAQASAAETGFVGLPGITMKADGVEMVINTASADGRVIDYSAQNLDVTSGLSFSGTGTSNTVAYTLDAPGDETIGIDVGYAEMDIGGFVQVIGGLNFQKGADIEVDMEVEGGVLDLIDKPQIMAQAIWSSVKRKLAVNDMFAQANSFTEVMAIVTDALDVINSLSDPVKMLNQIVTMLEGVDFNLIQDVKVSTLTVGASNVNVFAGMGGYFRDVNEDGRIYTSEYVDADGVVWAADPVNDEAVGFVLENVGMGLGFFTEENTAESYYALKVAADTVGLVGFGPIEMQARDIEVIVNHEASGKTINFGASFENGFNVPAGGAQTVNFDFSGKRIGVNVGQAIMRLGEFLSLQGGFVFEQGAIYQLDVSTGLGDMAKLGDAVMDAIGLSDLLAEMGLGNSNFSTFEDVTFSSMVISASNIEAFAGIGGPYKQDFDWDEDSDGDGNPYNDYYVNPDAMGLALEDIDFAYMMLNTETPILKEYLRQFQAAKLTAGFAGLVGAGEDINNNGVIDTYIPQDLNANGIRDQGENEFTPTSEDTNGNGRLDATVSMQARDIGFFYNTGPLWGETMGPAFIDFASSFADFTEDANGNGILDQGEDLNHDGVIDTGAMPVNAGTDVVYMDFDQSVLRADVGFAELKLADFITLNGGFSFTKLTNEEVVVDTGDLGSLIAPLASAVGEDSTQVKLDVDMLMISATDVYGFAGVGGSHSVDTNGDGVIDYLDDLDDGAVGLSIQDVDLAAALSTPSIAQIPGTAQFVPSFLSVKASVDYAGLVGTDDVLTANLQDINININTLLPPEALMATGYGAAVYGAALAAGALPSIDWAASYSGEDLNNNFVLDEGENINGVNEMGEMELNRGLLVNPNGAEPFFLDFDSETLEVNGYAEFALLDMMQVSAGFSLGKTIEEVTFHDLASGTDGTGSAVALHLAIADGYGFVADPQFYAAQNAIRTALYGYEPGYWKDVNGDSKITDADGGVHIDHPIMGLAVEDFNAGIVIMRQTGYSQWNDVGPIAEAGLNVAGLVNVYAGVTGYLGSLQLVGVPETTLSAQNFALDANISVNPLVYVDFSKSGKNRAGFAIDMADGVALDFSHLSGLQVGLEGQAVADIADLAGLSGSFAFEVGENGLTALVDAQAYLGKGVVDFDTHAAGVLAINGDGLAMKAALGAEWHVENVFELNAELALEINTMGADYTFAVPENFVETLGYAQVVVSATPPGKDAPLDAYAAIYGNGALTLLDLASFKGDFFVALALDADAGQLSATMEMNASMELKGLTSVAATGSLTFENNGLEPGLYGSLQIGEPGGSPVITSDLLTLSGSFLFQINTFGSTRMVNALKYDSHGNLLGTEKVEIGARTLHLSGGADLNLFNKVSASGLVAFTLNAQGFDGAVDLSLDLGIFGSLDVQGAASLRLDREHGPAFALNLAASGKAGIGVGSVGISADALVQINTGAVKRLDVPAHSFRIKLAGNMNLLVFKTTFKGEIFIQKDEFYLEVSEARLKIGPINAKLSGFVSSNGQFSFETEASLWVRLWPVTVSGSMYLKIDNSGFEGSVWGRVTLNMFGLSASVKGGGELKLKTDYVSARLGASITIGWGWFSKTLSAYETFNWYFTPSAELATLDNKALFLDNSDSGQTYEIDSTGNVIVNKTDHLPPTRRSVPASDNTPITVALSAASGAIGGRPMEYLITLSHPVADDHILTVVLDNGQEVQIPAGETSALVEGSAAMPAVSLPEIARIFISNNIEGKRLEALDIVQGRLEAGVETFNIDPSQLVLEHLGNILAAARIAESVDDAEIVVVGDDESEAFWSAFLTVAGGDGFGNLVGLNDGGVDGEFVGGDVEIWQEEVYI